MLPEPNHICKYCGRRYYACDYCVKTSYRGKTCSPECYSKYIEMVSSNEPLKNVNGVLRIDSDNSIESLIRTKELSIEEVKRYIPEVEEIGIGTAVDIINKAIKEENL